MPRIRRHRAPVAFYVLAVALFGIGATATVLWTRGYTIDFKKQSTYKTGLLVLKSGPSKAYVTIDNHLREEKTPTRIKLQGGTYHVKVDKPGLLPFEKDIRLEEEHAVFEDNITLWRDHPAPKPLADSVTSFTVAGNNHQFAYVQSGAGGVSLFVGGTSDEPVKVGQLGPAYAAPTSFTFSSDATAVLVSTPTESTIVPLSGNPTTLPVGGRTSFAVGSRDSILAQGVDQLVAVSAAGTSPVVGTTTAWTTTSDGLYVAGADRVVTRIDSRGNQKAVSRTIVFRDLLGVRHGDVVYGRDGSGTLYLIAPDATTPVPIAADVSTFGVSPDGNTVAFVSELELRLWHRSAGQASLITRFAQPVAEPTPAAGGQYAIFRQSGVLHALPESGGNDVAITELADATPAVLLDGDVLISLTNGQLALRSLSGR